MEIKMKKCGECGKMFVPRNPRAKYCYEKHYRPCPVCGKPVELQYPGYPAPRCTTCRELKLRAGTKAASTVTYTPENLGELPVEYVERKYVGKSNFHFVTGHTYLVKAKENRPYGYLIKAIKDITENEDIDDTEMPISAISSFGYFFKEVATANS